MVQPKSVPKKQQGGCRKAMSMYGSLDQPRKQERTPGINSRSRRPQSVCMLTATQSSALFVANSSIGKTGNTDIQHHRLRKVDIRAADGIKQDIPPSFRLPPFPQQEVLARQPLPQRLTGRPRPVSMTVLELRALEPSSSQNELAKRTFSDAASLPRTGFRWRLFGRQTQEKAVAQIPVPTATKPEASKKKFNSLRRSLSLRLKRNCNQPEQSVKRERTWTTSVKEDVSMSNRPFSYLTGRTLATAHRQDEDQRCKQYIQFQTKGKVAVMEVPLAPVKLTKPLKSTSGEPNLWQLITSRFKRKSPSSSSKSESGAESQPTANDLLVRNTKPLSVAMEAPRGIDFSKGQGKPCEISWISFPRPYSSPASRSQKCTEN